MATCNCVVHTFLAFLQINIQTNHTHVAYMRKAYITNENTAKNTPKHLNVWLIIVCEIDFGGTPAVVVTHIIK